MNKKMAIKKTLLTLLLLSHGISQSGIAKYTNEKPVKKDDQKLYTKCFGENDIVCIRPNLFAAGSFLEGDGPFTSSIIRSEFGATLTSEKASGYTLDIKWSVLPFVLGPYIRDKVDHQIEDIRLEKQGEVDLGRAQVDYTYSQTFNQYMDPTVAALKAMGLQPGTEEYNQKYAAAYLAISNKLKPNFAPYYAQVNLGQETLNEMMKAANNEAEKRSQDAELMFAARTFLFDMDNTTFISNLGLDNLSGGFGRPGDDLGSANREQLPEAVQRTGNGSYGYIGQPGSVYPTFMLSADKNVKIGKKLNVKITGWVNHSGMVAFDGDQLISNWYGMSNEDYERFSVPLVPNEGGTKACYNIGEQNENPFQLAKACVSVQASDKGATPAIDLKLNVVKDLYLYLATSYINHSVQASGFAGRAQLTAKVFQNNLATVYISGFFEGIESLQDYGRFTKSVKEVIQDSAYDQYTEVHANNGMLRNVKAFGGAVDLEFSPVQTRIGKFTSKLGLEGKIVDSQIGNANIQDPQVTLTFGTSYNDQKNKK